MFWRYGSLEICYLTSKAKVKVIYETKITIEVKMFLLCFMDIGLLQLRLKLGMLNTLMVYQQ